jgi:hypothetical protein
MNKIEETRNSLYRRANINGIELPDLSPVMNGTLKTRLLQVLRDNIEQLWKIGIVDIPFLRRNFELHELEQEGFFTEGIHTTDCRTIVACGTAEVTAQKTAQSFCFNQAKLIAAGGMHRVFDQAEIHCSNEAAVWAFDESVVVSAPHSVVFLHENARVVDDENAQVQINMPTPSRYKSDAEGKAHYSRLAYQQSCLLSSEEIEEMRIQGEKEK